MSPPMLVYECPLSLYSKLLRFDREYQIFAIMSHVYYVLGNPTCVHPPEINVTEQVSCLATCVTATEPLGPLFWHSTAFHPA